MVVRVVFKRILAARIKQDHVSKHVLRVVCDGAALCLQNSTTTRLGFKLHLPSASLAKQIISSMGDMAISDQDIKLRSLKPGEGARQYIPCSLTQCAVMIRTPHDCACILPSCARVCYMHSRLPGRHPSHHHHGQRWCAHYHFVLHPLKPPLAEHVAGRYLPVVACLDGVLYLEPRSCIAAQHDVIRLFPDVAAMPAQQGYICCMPLDPTGKLSTAMHFSVKVWHSVTEIVWLV